MTPAHYNVSVSMGVETSLKLIGNDMEDYERDLIEGWEDLVDYYND